MAKKGKSNKKQTKKKTSTNVQNEKSKIENIISGLDGNIRHSITVIAAIIIFLCLFYLLTVHITLKNNEDTTNTEDTTDGVISYDEIMVGRSFSVSDGEYLVIYYDKSDSEISSTYSGLVSTYEAKEDHLDVYTVDMSNGLNKSYSKEESNTNPSKASEIAINGPTLIKFSNGTVADYIEGHDNITNYLQ